MSLLSINELSVAFDDPPLLDRVNINIERGERVCLVGRNGTGKSTLMKIVVGEFTPDSGEVARERGAAFSYLPQEVPEDISGTIFEVVARGMEETGKLIGEYHAISGRLTGHGDAALMKRLEEIQHQLELNGGWHMHSEVERVISHMRLDPDVKCETLSAGMKRRALLARALVSKPDLLLLDEPTNHLDIDSICWLEEYLTNYEGTLLFVTHDKMFLRKLATRIVELDRGRLHSWACDYETYLKRKEAALEAETSQRAEFNKKVAREEVWLRQGIKARRTRNEGRVKALMRMREVKRTFRQRIGSIHMEAQEAERTGKLVIEAENVSFGYDGNQIVDDFSTTIARGDKVGIMGPNGSGKTTLLKILLGKLKTGAGCVRHGIRLKIAYFDQLRSQLDENKTVADNIADGNPVLTINGKQRHVIGYLQGFLFPPERARSPVSVLSGGERNRLMLAKLFTMPSNVLVLDEPTNDLDAESLDLLEDMLVGYGGTVLLVSHDRDFLNNVVTSTIALEGEGCAREYVGGYDDWLRQRRAKTVSTPTDAERKKSIKREPRQQPHKLGFNEKRELEKLPERIDALEKEKRALTDSLSTPDVYTNSDALTKATKRIEEIELELASAYDRWTELEDRR